MRIRPGILLVVIVALAVLFGGRYLGWFGGAKPGSNTTGQPPEPTPSPTTVRVSPAPPTPAPEPPATPRNTAARLTPSPLAVKPKEMPATATPTLIKDWEDRIDNILTTPGDETSKSKELLAMLPNLPEDGQVEAAQHLSNLLADEDFKLLTPTLTNATVADAVLEVLMTDVLNRPNQLKLPALLDVARIPNHPKAEEARDILEVYVDENYGEDWGAWQTAVEKWLKENPDE